MKGLISFIYAILVVFALLGSAGYLFYIHEPQFAVADLILLPVLGFAYAGKFVLPTYKIKFGFYI